MAKRTDNLAASLETENTGGGLLPGFLAEEEAFDRRAQWRLGSWGAGAVGAVTVALLASQSSLGWRREQLAAADLARQAQQIQAVAKESQNETRRLASAIDTLNSDRDRLYTRLTTVEQGLESVTGAFARQNSPTALPSAAPASAAGAAPMSAAAAAQAAVQSPNPPPVIGPVATTAPATAEKPRADVRLPSPSPSTVASVAPGATTAAAGTASAAPGTASAAPGTASAAPEAPATSLMASKSMMAPPDPAAAKLMAPEPSPKEASLRETPAKETPARETPVKQAMAKEAAANDAPGKEAPSKEPPAKAAPALESLALPPAANAEPDKAPPPGAEVQRTEFAVDVGGANSIGGLRALWRGLLKSRSNAPLAALHPIIIVKEANTGFGMQLRLAAGPLSDAAAAARICAAMIENQRPCETTVYDGQRLAMKADDDPPAAAASATAAQGKEAPAKPVAAKPTERHHHSYAKHVSNDDEPAKKPEPPSLTTTLSSYFGKH